MKTKKTIIIVVLCAILVTCIVASVVAYIDGSSVEVLDLSKGGGIYNSYYGDAYGSQISAGCYFTFDETHLEVDNYTCRSGVYAMSVLGFPVDCVASTPTPYTTYAEKPVTPGSFDFGRFFFTLGNWEY